MNPCVVLQEIPTHGLGVSLTVEMFPELLHSGHPFIFIPQVHPPSPSGDVVLKM